MKKQNVQAAENFYRNYALDALKVAATIIIIFHHYQQLTNSSFSAGINYYGGWFYFGMMVELFFLISGYLMHRYILKIQEGTITLKDWYMKRSVRLLPMVSVSVAVTELVNYIHKLLCSGGFCQGEKTVDVFGALITSLGIHSIGVFENPRINSPTWYISVLLLTYVAFFILTKLATHWKCSPFYLYIFAVLLSCGIRKNGVAVPFFTDHTTRGYICFFYGILLAEFVRKYGVSTKFAIMDLSVVTALLGLLLFKREFVIHGLWNLLSFVFFPGLILLTETDLSKRFFRHRFWGTWGQISFNAYLWHCPMITAMHSTAHFFGITPYYAQRKWMYLFCLLTMVAGTISFYCIEKPLNSFLQNKMNYVGILQLAGKEQRNGTNL